MAVMGAQEKYFIIANFGLCLLYLLILDIYAGEKADKTRTVLNYVFLSVILIELFITSYKGVNTNRTTSRSAYPDSYAQVQKVLSLREPAGSGFYRTELTNWVTLNDPSLYGYNGISVFSSTVNAGVTKFMQGIGLPAWDAGNRYYYAETSPLTNAFLNLRYLISRDGNPGDGSFFWKIAGRTDNALLLENKSYLPLGFMAEKEMSAYKHDANPFLSQNNLFSLATGLDGDLFTVTNVLNNPYTKKDADGNDTFNLDYEFQADGIYYAYCEFFTEGNISVSYKDAVLRKVENRRPYVFTLGSFLKGDIITFTAGPGASKGPARIQVARIDDELFDRGYALLADEILDLTEFSETKITGNITALKDGLLYTSIPDDKNWIAFVDGVKTTIIHIDGCMIALRLRGGTHEIEFRYQNGNLKAGIIINLLFLTLFAVSVMRSALFWYKVHREAVNYLFVGGATTFVNWCVYGLVVRLAGYSVTAGSVIAWIAALVFAFITNKIWVFESRAWQPLLVLREGSAFLGARIISGLVEIIGVPFLYILGLDYPLLGTEGFAAKVSVSVIVIVLNYIFSKLFVFRRGKAG
jgi:uncharacterized membrane protein YfhO/putative flippase GtrA